MTHFERKYKLALCQMPVSYDKDENLETASRYVSDAADAGAKLICLPEMWNTPYDSSKFREFSEPADGQSVEVLKDLAKRNEIFLVGGSIPELDGEEVYNTSFIFDPTGAQIARHRKVNMFEVNIEGGIRFREADTLSAGDGLTIVDTDFGKIGVAICFDVRFPEMFGEMKEAGAHLILLPAAFNMTTGPAHWDLLMRSRAMDNQLYFAACSAARDTKSAYISYAHSCIASPWGEYAGSIDSQAGIVYSTIDIDYINKIRAELPIGNPAL
ncbi:MAG: carbon-nitrogen hydrolase family protein [Clostridiales Family XIII bacterium]|jgi:predicted amidohydrolase|nr:carbon-nitrogen hydrolase family protein [Clostridiales Family XIII bacterium]